MQVEQDPAAIDLARGARDAADGNAGDDVLADRYGVGLALFGADHGLDLLGERPDRAQIYRLDGGHWHESAEIGAGFGAQGVRRRRHVGGGFGHWRSGLSCLKTGDTYAFQARRLGPVAAREPDKVIRVPFS